MWIKNLVGADVHGKSIKVDYANMPVRFISNPKFAVALTIIIQITDYDITTLFGSEYKNNYIYLV